MARPHYCDGIYTMPVTSVGVQPAGAPNNVARDADFSITPGAVGAVHVVTFRIIPTAYFTVVHTSSTIKFPDGTAVGITAPPASTFLNRFFRDLGDASVDATATFGAFDRPRRRQIATPTFQWAEQNMGGFQFAP